MMIEGTATKEAWKDGGRSRKLVVQGIRHRQLAREQREREKREREEMKIEREVNKILEGLS